MRRYVLGVVLSGLVALVGAPAAFAGGILPPLPLCSGGTTTNCMVSVTNGGGPNLYPSDPGDPYQISAAKFPAASDQNFFFNINTLDGMWNLPLAHVWEVAINTGTYAPSETFSRGRNVDVVRGGVAGSRTVRFTMQPVRLADGAATRWASAARPPRRCVPATSTAG